MRIGVSIVIIIDLCIRFSDLEAHYCDAGIWPLHVVKNFAWKSGFWSIHLWSGTYYFIALLFAIHFLCTFFLLIGYKTRISNLIVWLLYLSLHNRNLFILQSGDELLRLLLFWGLFLPWQHYFSVDAKRYIVKPTQNIMANIGYLLLIASVYIFTVFFKNSPEWRSEGTAIYYALSLDQIRLPFFGDYLYKYSILMRCLTHLVFVIECLIPILILAPSKKGNFRLLAFVLLVTLHIGIGLTLYVGLFYIINITTALALLPTQIINRLSKVLKFLTLKQFFGLRKKQPYISSIKNSICFSIIILSLTYNLQSMWWFNYELKPVFQTVINIFRFDQYWGMFSPSIIKNDGWFVYYGSDSIGRQWDLYKNQDYVDFSKPKHIVSMYKNDRWRKLAENMQDDNHTFLRPLYCNYYLKKWQKNHPDKKIASLSLYFMSKINLPDYRTTNPIKNFYCICNEQ
ncbi:MAG: hypothetical protein JSU07_00125 [Bacteroidetes bacterium]|nr:hypothetical protein [Bacteroidota bacterium]